MNFACRSISRTMTTLALLLIGAIVATPTARAESETFSLVPLRGPADGRRYTAPAPAAPLPSAAYTGAGALACVVGVMYVRRRRIQRE
jgi:hypothetical protein